MSDLLQQMFETLLNDPRAVREAWRKAQQKHASMARTRGDAVTTFVSLTQVMGGFDALVEADVTPATGEWIYTPPKCQLYRDEVPVGEEHGMEQVGAYKWRVLIEGAYPEPTSAKVTVQFINSSFQVTTVTDVDLAPE